MTLWLQSWHIFIYMLKIFIVIVTGHIIMWSHHVDDKNVKLLGQLTG